MKIYILYSIFRMSISHTGKFPILRDDKESDIVQLIEFTCRQNIRLCMRFNVVLQVPAKLWKE